MIRFSNVKYQYQQQAFCFDVDIPKGNIVAVLGSSGAGKSTLLNLAAGFIKPKAGDILIAAESVLDIQPHLRPLAILFQENNLFAHLTVADNIGLGLDSDLKLNQQQHINVKTICERLGIAEFLNRYPDELSGGQKQRVALARCFVQKKPLLLLDEPFSALDPILREEMLAIVKELATVQSVTVLMVTHHISDARHIASHFLFIDQGKVSSFDEIDKLTSNNEDVAIKRYVTAGQIGK